MSFRSSAEKQVYITAVYKLLAIKGFPKETVLLRYGNVMDDYWVTVKIPGYPILDCEHQYSHPDAFNLMLEEIEKRIK